MDIDLTSSEKKSFFSFLALYLGSSFILMLIALFFYYQNEKTLYLDLVKSNMQNIVSKVSNEIIISASPSVIIGEYTLSPKRT